MADLAKQSAESLQARLVAAQGELRTFRYASAGSRTKNVRQGRELRREIARLMTELRARTLANTPKKA